MSSFLKFGLAGTDTMTPKAYFEYFDSLRIPYEDIASATNNFSEANLIAQGTCYRVYKGQLVDSGGELIDIVVRTSGKTHLEQTLSELFLSKSLTHTYIATPFKYIEQNSTAFFINKYEVNGSLVKHLTNFTDLTWIIRLKICVGVANALCYLHGHYDDDDTYVIHGNIKSSKILLNQNWDPKLHGFRFARDANKNHGYITSKYNGALQYMDPAYENTKTLTNKSDVFSFGVVMFEILFGTMASTQNGDHWYFARLARLHYEARTLDKMINPGLHRQMDQQSLRLFLETAYYCLKELPAERPAMDQVVQKLEAALDHQQKQEVLLKRHQEKDKTTDLD